MEEKEASEIQKAEEKDKPAVKKKKTTESTQPVNQEYRAKLNLNLPLDHPFASFSQALKKRGIKDCDINELAGQALSQVGADWWDKQLDHLTPLEYRVNVALSDPSMRDKLSELLAQQKLDS